MDSNWMHERGSPVGGSVQFGRGVLGCSKTSLALEKRTVGASVKTDDGDKKLGRLSHSRDDAPIHMLRKIASFYIYIASRGAWSLLGEFFMHLEYAARHCSAQELTL